MIVGQQLSLSPSLSFFFSSLTSFLYFTLPLFLPFILSLSLDHFLFFSLLSRFLPLFYSSSLSFSPTLPLLLILLCRKYRTLYLAVTDVRRMYDLRPFSTNSTGDYYLLLWVERATGRWILCNVMMLHNVHINWSLILHAIQLQCQYN